jgi:hypothetical protein
MVLVSTENTGGHGSGLKTNRINTESTQLPPSTGLSEFAGDSGWRAMWQWTHPRGPAAANRSGPISVPPSGRVSARGVGVHSASSPAASEYSCSSRRRLWGDGCSAVGEIGSSRIGLPCCRARQSVNSTLSRIGSNTYSEGAAIESMLVAKAARTQHIHSDERPKAHQRPTCDCWEKPVRRPTPEG